MNMVYQFFYNTRYSSAYTICPDGGNKLTESSVKILSCSVNPFYVDNEPTIF